MKDMPDKIYAYNTDDYKYRMYHVDSDAWDGDNTLYLHAAKTRERLVEEFENYFSEGAMGIVKDIFNEVLGDE